MSIYLDNASTSFPKPSCVAEAVYSYMTQAGSNINRGTGPMAHSVADQVFTTRQLLCELFHGEDCKNVVFTKNITEALNQVIKGLLKPGDHVLVSAMEHNAIMRPLQQLAAQGISFTRMPCDQEGQLLCADLEQYLQPQTKAVIMTHASNVCGTLLPITAAADFCRRHNLYFILDTAQTAGLFPIDMQDLNLAALCFTGHKTLLGPQGIGGFILREDLIQQLEPLIAGGTGSISHRESIPSFMPDRFEAGTPNLPGIIGLKAALKWLKDQDCDRLREQELKLTAYMLEELKPLEEQQLLQIIGTKDLTKRTSIISITTSKMDIAELAYILSEEYGIAARVGLHCAPQAHKTLGTYPKGTLRFSLGWSNSLEDITAAVKALETVLGHESVKK